MDGTNSNTVFHRLLMRINVIAENEQIAQGNKRTD